MSEEEQTVSGAAAEAARLHRSGAHAAASEAYTEAINLAELSADASILRATLYANRSAARLHCAALVNAASRSAAR